jgi:uncharacterized protein
MILVDTSAWVEYLIDSKTGRKVEKLLPPRDQWLVPTIVQLELAKWLARETDEQRTDRTLAFSQMCVIAPLTTPLAYAAATLCRFNHLATADAIVYATAQAHGAKLLTCDAHFKLLGDVILVEKVD